MTNLVFSNKAPRAFSWPVTLELPTAEGKWIKQGFTARFVALPSSRFLAVVAQGDSQLLTAVLMGWSGITDEKGGEFVFSEKARAALIDDPFVAPALVRAYLEAISGGRAVKNSKT